MWSDFPRLKKLGWTCSSAQVVVILEAVIDEYLTTKELSERIKMASDDEEGPET